MSNEYQETGLEIAVIGMAGRFPGAKDVEEFWENLKNGVESIGFYSPGELLAAGISADLLDNPDYVKCGGGIVDDIEYFDAGYFGYSPVEAELMDPQARIFHECTWHALENAGYDPFAEERSIGIYAGATRNLNWEASVLLSGKATILGDLAAQLLIDGDFLCTRVSYNLNLKGPAVVVKTACSTSLVAIHMACQSILNGECDMALAGGVSITPLRKTGYLYQEGMISSADGHCRAFDGNSPGTVSGNGAGVVVLKCLVDARADNDTILAVIKGSAINNDGFRKVGFTAPSIEGQCEVIGDALQIARAHPETITCVETHGTGTSVGDPIEIEALKLAFNTTKKQYCRIGSVKTNVGHLDAAAGVTGFIKMVLALKYRQIPPSLHFETSNPKIDFENSPFIVNTELFAWKNNGQPLRAGVSSFGIGGTNAHVILEEFPLSNEEIPDPRDGSLDPPLKSRQYQLILLSAQSKTALDKMTQNLEHYLKKEPTLNLADVAYTLQVGRKACKHRKMWVTDSSAPDFTGEHIHIGTARDKNRLVFMFPGQGAQYVNMGLDLYRTQQVFRQEMDRCFEIVNGILDYDLKEILYPGEMDNRSYRSNKTYIPDINQTEIAQPLLFVFEYSMAKLSMHWGLRPYAMIGHSIGEYTAACLAGVFSLEDALKLVALRGRLMQQLPPGAMLSVTLPEKELTPLLQQQSHLCLSLAAVNAPSFCVVSGPGDAVETFVKQLEIKGIRSQRLHTSHAFHSGMMDPILATFEKAVKEISLNKPRLPYIANVTGTWITVEEATSPQYWAAHLRRTVRFSEGISQLIDTPNPIFIELGPGRSLSTLVHKHMTPSQTDKNEKNKHPALNLVKHPTENIRDDRFLLTKLGQLWLNGVKIDWQEFYKGEERFRIPLPLYPFESRRYYNDTDPFKAGTTMMGRSLTGKKPDKANWFYTQQWLRSTLTGREDSTPAQSSWLVFSDDSPLANQLVKRLEADNHRIVVVKTGIGFNELGTDEYTVDPGNPGDYEILFKRLAEAGKIPGNIAHLWCLPGGWVHRPDQEFLDRELDRVLDRGLFSLLYIAGAIGSANIPGKIQLGVITGNMQCVTGDEELHPGKAAILAPVKIIPLEYANISSRGIDITNPGEDRGKIEFLVENVLREFSTGFGDQPVIAYRGANRWQETFEPVKLDIKKTTPHHSRLKEQGVYLITGGFGGMGFALAEHLANTLNARLILVDLLTPPTGEKLDKWLYSDERKKDIRDKQQKIKDWETRGAEIRVHDVDVSDYQGMKEVISQAEEQFGKINGVIHTAGLIDYAGVIQRRTREMTAALLAAKIKGTLVLDNLLGHHRLDFMVLFSSSGNVFYKVKFGQVGYNAGHEFMDIFSYYKQQQGQFTVTIDWNDWTEVGMTARVTSGGKADSSGHSGNRTGIENILSISPAEGIDVFRRILEHNLSRVVVSHHDLHRLLELMNNPAAAETQTGSFAGMKENTVRLRERPGLSTEYVPPSNELEQFILDIWEEILGYTKIGITDDWFELGGDSLTVAWLISRLKEVYPVEISINNFFENPTAAGLAEMIRELLYEKIKSLSEEELDALVEQDIL